MKNLRTPLLLAGIVIGIGLVISLITWIYLPETFDWWDVAETIIWSGAVGGVLGVVFSKTINTETPPEVRDQFAERAIRQSTQNASWQRSPIVWVASFSVVAFIIISYLT